MKITRLYLKEKEIDARRKILGLNDQAKEKFMNKGIYIIFILD